MRNLFALTTGITIADAVTALALPPGSFGRVDLDGASWTSGYNGIPAEFELEIWSPAGTASNLTNAILYGATTHPLVVADITIATLDIDLSANTITKTAHGLLTGDGPLPHTTTGTAIGGLDTASDGYYAIKVDADTFKLAASLTDALAGTAIDLTANGSGTRKLVDSANTARVHWETHDDLLGVDRDGAIAITANVGYRKRVPHSPRVFAYALVATIDANAVSAAIYPIRSA